MQARKAPPYLTITKISAPIGVLTTPPYSTILDYAGSGEADKGKGEKEMKVTIHRVNHDGSFRDIENLLPKEKVNEFIEKNVKPNEYFSVGNMYPDGWYEREYRKP